MVVDYAMLKLVEEKMASALVKRMSSDLAGNPNPTRWRAPEA